MCEAVNSLDLTPDGIAVVTLSNPPVNAMDAPLLEELTGLFEGLGAEAAVRAAVVTGHGRAFSAASISRPRRSSIASASAA